MLVGIDEVGRGPLAGPLLLCALGFPDYQQASQQVWWEQIGDSKKLSEKRREQLNLLIQPFANFGFGWVSATTIDQIGIAAALKQGASLAVTDLLTKIKTPITSILIDGNQNLLIDSQWADITTTLIKAEDRIKEVGAASIIAKVARDHYMCTLEQTLPGHSFARHKGYGTALHMSKIAELGLTIEHRRSFVPARLLPPINPRDQTSTHNSSTAIGRQAEMRVAQFLKKQGHAILGQNIRSYDYEIDIVSFYQQTIFCTEVRYRKHKKYGDGLASINQRKAKQIQYAANELLGELQAGKRRLWTNEAIMPDLQDCALRIAIANIDDTPIQPDQWIVLE